MNTHYFSQVQVAQQTGIPFYRIRYAEQTGRLPQPTKILGAKAYTPQDITTIQSYFAGRKIKDGNDHNHKRQNIPTMP